MRNIDKINIALGTAQAGAAGAGDALAADAAPAAEEIKARKDQYPHDCPKWAARGGCARGDCGAGDDARERVRRGAAVYNLKLRSVDP